MIGVPQTRAEVAEFCASLGLDHAAMAGWGPWHAAQEGTHLIFAGRIRGTG